MGNRREIKEVKMDKFLTIKDIEGLMQVTRKTVLAWIKTGGLKAYKVGGTSWRIRERDLKRFIK
jgi:excisionase family DNA binding protein